MTPERFRQIRNLYEAVVELAPERQREFLSQASEGDQDLSSEVERLLMARERTAIFIAQPLLERIDLDASATAMSRMEGRILGHYRILREIGRGGMGTVYLASRADGVVHQQVAIKIMHSGAQEPDFIRRFHQEREILASLDHPSIARLIDADSTEEGLPYFVMDYVDGEPIDLWCNRNQLDVTGRLRLFRALCQGVQYAHKQKIVHRDLKPRNILVASNGTVKILDFGIAKILGDGTRKEAATETLSRMMTLEYASPEQVRGEAIDTTSDIYALGVVLYELLTGRCPYRLRNRMMHEAARVICEEEPALPSTVITDFSQEDKTAAGRGMAVLPEGSHGRLRHRLEGDLDNILLKALQKEPKRRYPSAEQFSDDLQKHLDGLPVSARKDTVGYRIEKFAKRHKVGFTASVLIAASLLIGLGTTLWQTKIAVQYLHEAPSPGRTAAIPIAELLLYNFIAWVALGAAAYFTRATIQRLTGSLVGGLVFTLLFIKEAALADSIGLGHFNWLFRPTLLGWSALVPFGAALVVIAWRVTRRFGWRGQLGLLVMVTIFGPIHDFVDASMMQIVTPVYRLTPWILDSLFWIVNITAAEAVMRIVAGPAAKDVLRES